MAPGGAWMVWALARMTVAAAAISSTVSPRMRSPIRKAPIWAGVAWPSMIRSKAASASARASGAPLARRASTGFIEAVVIGPMPSRRLGAGVAFGEAEEIAQQSMAVLGGDAFRMELNANDRQFLMRQPHDQPVLGPGGDLERGGQAFTLDDQRMIAGGEKGRGQTGEQAGAGVMHLAGLAMHRRGCAHHFAAE